MSPLPSSKSITRILKSAENRNTMCYMIRLGIKVTAKKWCFDIFLLDFDPAEQASESRNP